MEIKKLPTQPIIDDNATVKCTEMGNIVEVQYMSRCNKKQTIQKLDKDTYCRLDTGEVKEFIHGDSRKDNVNGLYKTFAKIRGLINTNCTDANKIRWITLTYKENMKDPKRLYKDFDRCRKKIYYYCIKQGYERPEYIQVVEPQARGAWHIHMMLIWKKQDAPFIPNKDLREMWGQGFVNIQRVKDIDNLGAYLTAYLADIELNENTLKYVNIDHGKIKEVEIDENGKKVSKKFIKGGRMALYPTGMNIVRHSKGIEKPSEEYLSYKEAKKKVLGATKTYENNILLSDDEYNFNSLIVKEQYNKIRSK